MTCGVVAASRVQISFIKESRTRRSCSIVAQASLAPASLAASAGPGGKVYLPVAEDLCILYKTLTLRDGYALAYKDHGGWGQFTQAEGSWGDIPTSER